MMKANKKNSFLEKAKSQYLKLTLNSLKLNDSYLVENTIYYNFNLLNLLIYSPNCENKHACSLKGVRKNDYNNMINKVFEDCHIEYINFFQFASCKNTNSKKINIINSVKEAITKYDNIAIIQTKNGIVKSFYTGLRNAIAHGNILKVNGKYYFYSLNKDPKSKSNQEKSISFLLIVNDIMIVNRLVDTILEYINKKYTKNNLHYLSSK